MNRTVGMPNPFEDSPEMDIIKLTETVLGDDSQIGYVTSEGITVPRNDAFSKGYKNGIELVKDRIWGADDVEVVFSDEAKRAMVLEAVNSPDTETGGALIGTWEKSADGALKISVERATGAGNEATKAAAMFSPHLGYYRSRVGYYRENYGWDYVGEWHKHPGQMDSLSYIDIKTADTLIESEGWPFLVLPVVTGSGDELAIDTHVALSKQLGGPTITEGGRIMVNAGDYRNDSMKAYI